MSVRQWTWPTICGARSSQWVKLAIFHHRSLRPAWPDCHEEGERKRNLFSRGGPRLCLDAKNRQSRNIYARACKRTPAERLCCQSRNLNSFLRHEKFAASFPRRRQFNSPRRRIIRRASGDRPAVSTPGRCLPGPLATTMVRRGRICPIFCFPTIQITFNRARERLGIELYHWLGTPMAAIQIQVRSRRSSINPPLLSGRADSSATTIAGAYFRPDRYSPAASNTAP